MATNIIDAISNLESGNTLTVTKNPDGSKTAHKVTLVTTAATLKAEQQDLEYNRKFIDLTGFYDDCALVYDPDNVFNIRSVNYEYMYANYNCYKVYLPVALSIYDSAFENCNQLTNVYLPKITYIGNRAFTRSPVDTIIISSVITIGSEAFSYTQLTSFLDLSSVIEIGNNAFESTSLLGISLQQVKHIG